VIDRAALILDIFALHARTAEAKIQVELAQLEYQRTRLTGFGVEMSRLAAASVLAGPARPGLRSTAGKSSSGLRPCARI